MERMNPMTFSRHGQAGWLIVALGLAILACDGGGSGGGDPTGPTDPVLTLTASPRAASVFGSSTLTARALNPDGSPVAAGSQIDLSTDFGNLAAPRIVTENSGLATTVLRGVGEVGTAVVNARLAGTSATAAASVRFGADGLQVLLVASPSAIAPQGSATLRITVLNTDDSPAPGVRLDLATTLGRLDALTVQTNAFGTTSTELRGDGQSGTATVSAVVVGSGERGQIQIGVGEGRSVSLTATPTRIGPTDAATLEATVREFDGRASEAGLQVSLTTTLGRLDATEITTNALGRGTTTLRGTGRSGVARLTANAPGALQQAVEEVEIGEGLSLRLTADPASIAPQGTAEIAVIVENFDGSRAGAGRRARLETSLGRLDNTAPVTATNGVARTSLRGVGEVGVATLTASVDGAAREARLQVRIGNGVNLTLTADPTEIDSDESSQLRVAVQQTDGSPVAAGIVVLLETTRGSLDNRSPVTDSRGLAFTTLRPQGQIGTATVTASLPGLGVASVIEIVITAPL